MQVKPLADRVLVKALVETESTKSGIIIPTTVEKERPERGEIIAVGQGKRLQDGAIAPMTVKVGDKVLFKKYGPDEIKIDGQDFLILEESDILGIIE
jgi:chaperonin GroES